jgi:hypothetical protein
MGAMISLSQWPADLYSKTLESKYSEVLRRATGATIDAKYDWGRALSREFARVNIYYQTFLVEHIDENEKYDVSQISRTFFFTKCWFQSSLFCCSFKFTLLFS